MLQSDICPLKDGSQGPKELALHAAPNFYNPQEAQLARISRSAPRCRWEQSTCCTQLGATASTATPTTSTSS